MANNFQQPNSEENPIDWKGGNLEGKEHACRVEITCAHPGNDGKMNVEMTYEGDPTLAAFLLESAQEYLAEEDAFSE